LVVSTLGIQIQRETIADLANDTSHLRSYLRLWIPAVLLALGLEIGFFITPPGLFAPKSLLALLLTPLWFISFTILTWLWLAYTRALTQILIGTRMGDRPPTGHSRIINVISAISASVLYAPALFALITVQVAGQPLPETLVPPGTNPDEFFGLMFGFSIVMLLLPAMAYFLGALLSVAGLHIALQFVQPFRRCPECDETTQHKITVGQTCEYCGSDLAAWIYAVEGGR